MKKIMRNRRPSRYVFGGIAITILGTVGLLGIITVSYKNILSSHGQRLLLVTLIIVIGLVSTSYSFWLASESEDGKGQNVLEKVLKYLSRQQGITDKEIATSIWGQTLGFLIILCVLLFAFSIIWLVFRVFHFAA